MKRVIVFFSVIIISACTNSAVEKPDNLIAEDKMVDIIYDMSLLQAMKLDNPLYLEQHKISPSAYIFVKYKVDSIQFAQNDRYYASQIDTYKKIYEKVEGRIDRNKKEADSLLKVKPEASPVPVVNPKKDSLVLQKSNLVKSKRGQLFTKQRSKK